MDRGSVFFRQFSVTNFRIQQKTSWVISKYLKKTVFLKVAQGDGCILILGHRMTVCGVSPKHTLMIDSIVNITLFTMQNPKTKNTFQVSSGPWHNQTRCNSKVYSTKQASEIILGVAGGSSPASSNRQESAGESCNQMLPTWLKVAYHLYPIISTGNPTMNISTFHKFPTMQLH